MYKANQIKMKMKFGKQKTLPWYEIHHEIGPYENSRPFPTQNILH